MVGRPLLLQVKLTFIDTIHPQSNKVIMGVKITALGESKLTWQAYDGLRNITGLRIMVYETPVTKPCFWVVLCFFCENEMLMQIKLIFMQ